MVWKQDELRPGAVTARACNAFRNSEEGGKERNRENSTVPVRMPLHKHGAPHMVRIATVSPDSLSQLRVWGSAHWVNDQEKDWCFLETSYMSAYSLGSHGNSDGECGRFQLSGQGGEAGRNEHHQGPRWCCGDLNPCLLWSQIHTHFPLPLESLIHTHTHFTSKAGTEFGEHRGEKKQEPMTVGQENGI